MTQRQGVLRQCKQRLSFLAVWLDDPITRTLWVSTPCVNALDPDSCQDTGDEQGRGDSQESAFFFVGGHKGSPEKLIKRNDYSFPLLARRAIDERNAVVYRVNIGMEGKDEKELGKISWG